MADEPLGWLITVEFPDGSPPVVYNVAIPNERGAIEAVKAVLPNGKGAVVKVKSMLVERVYRGLKMKPGDVLAGARSRSKKPAAPQSK